METTTTRTGVAAGPAAARRLPLLDVLRGVAILGTLGTNVWIFTAPGGDIAPLAAGTPLVPLDSLLTDPSLSGIAEVLLRFAANGKFLALLTVLFGVGLAIQFRSAARRGDRWPGRYRWRALFLLFEGAVHFTLVFAWDVLMGYAVTALIVAWLLARSRVVQRVALWGSGAFHVIAMTALTVVLVAAARSEPGGGDASAVEDPVVALYAQGGYLDLVAFRLANVAVLRAEMVVALPLMVCLFLVGVRLFRAGAFDPGASGRRIRTRMLVWGVGAGLPLNLATTLAGPDFFLLDRYVAAPVLAIGYIGLVGVVMDRVRRPGPLTHGLSALGRTALSGYVAQNVACMLLCYGFGLGLAERMAGSGPWWVLGLWAAVSLLLVVAASLWLRRFSQGPLEAVQKWTLARLPSAS